MNFVGDLPQVAEEEYDAFPFESNSRGTKYAIAFSTQGCLVAVRLNLNQSIYENEVTEEEAVYCVPSSCPQWKKNRQKVLMSKEVAVFVEQGANNYGWGYGDVDSSFQEEKGTYEKIRIVRKREWSSSPPPWPPSSSEAWRKRSDSAAVKMGASVLKAAVSSEEEASKKRKDSFYDLHLDHEPKGAKKRREEEEEEDVEKEREMESLLDLSLAEKQRSFAPVCSSSSRICQVRYKENVWGSKLEVRWVQFFERIGFRISKAPTFFQDLEGEMEGTYTPDLKLIGVRLLDPSSPPCNVYVDIKPFERACSSFVKKCEMVSKVHMEHMLLLEGEPLCPLLRDTEYSPPLSSSSYPKVRGMRGTLWLPGEDHPVHNVVLMKEGSDSPFLSPLLSSLEKRHKHPFLMSIYSS